MQAIKAGLLEIADIFAVNKADRKGVERTVAALEMMLEMGRRDGAGRFPSRASDDGGRVSARRRGCYVACY